MKAPHLRFASVFLLLLALTANSPAATYYVRTDGNNANAGTGPLASQAWASIDFAFDSGLNGGDIVYVMPGTYTEQISGSSRYESSIVTFIGDTDGSVFGTPGFVTVQAPTSTTLLSVSTCSNYRFQRFVFSGVSDANVISLAQCNGFQFINGAIVGGFNGAILSSCNSAVFRNMLVTGSQNNGLSLSSSGSAEISNCTVANHANNAILFSSSFSCSVRNCVLANSLRGLSSSGSSVTHTNNLFHGNSTDLSGATADATEVFADPQFLSASDYRIQETSPAIDVGADLSSVIADDYYGNPRPSGAGWDIGFHEYQQVVSNGKTILFVRNGSSSYTAAEQLRVDQFESWGYTVTPIDDSDTQANFDAAFLTADVVYMAEDISSGQLGNKVREATIGVVSEELFVDDALGFTTLNGTTDSRSTIQITDNTHPITDGFSLATLTLTSSTQELTSTLGQVGAGVDILAFAPGVPVLMAVEEGRELANTVNGSNLAFGRRVRLPWGGDNFDFTTLNSDGITLLQQAIEWAASPGLVAHWKLDETTGTTAVDSTGNGNDGTYVNSPTPTTQAPRGLGIAVSGGDRIDAGNFAVSGTEITLSAWFYLNTFTNDARILIRGSANDGPGQSWGLVAEETGNLEFRLARGGGEVDRFIVSDVLQLNRWHHAVGIYDGSEIRIYLDGELVRLTTLNSGGDIKDDATHTVTIGDSIVGNRPVDGSIDEVRVYSYALNEVEVLKLYGLQGHYKLDETSGTVAADSSGLGNDGTHMSGPTVGVDAVRASGVTYNDASTDDYTLLPNTLLHGASTGSIAWWMKTTRTGTTVVLSGATAGDSNQLTMWFDGSTTFRPFTLGSSNSYTIDDIADGLWHHYVYQGNGPAGIEKLYVDGSLVVDATIAASTDTLYIDPGGLLLGQEQDSVGGGFDANQLLDGSLDDVRIYDRMLSDAEVAELYGLVGHWKLDETAGSTATDSSLVGNNGDYLNGATPNAAGPFPGSGAIAGEFDGADDNVGAPTNSAYQITESITLAGWVRFDQAVADQTGQHFIFARTDWVSQTGYALFANQPYSSGLVFRIFNGTTFADVEWDASDIAAGEWHHVVGVYDGNVMSLYVDGELRATNNSFVGPIAPYNNSVGIGWTLDGRLHDVRLYNRAVTTREVSELYGLVAHWKLDELSGTIATDSSGAGNHGSYIGSPTLGAASNGNATLSTAVELDGSNYVETPGVIVNSVTDGVSLVGWARLSELDTGGAELVTLGGHFGLSPALGTNATAVGFNGVGLDAATSGTSFLNTGWRHYASTYNPDTQELSLYIDGAFVSKTTMSGQLTLTGLGSVTRIGEFSTNSDHSFTGKIDDVRVYQRMLQPEEIQRLYDQTRVQGLRIIRWVEQR